MAIVLSIDTGDGNRSLLDPPCVCVCVKCDDYLGDHANALKRGREGAQIAETRVHASEQIGGVGGGSGRGFQQTVPGAGGATAGRAMIRTGGRRMRNRDGCER